MASNTPDNQVSPGEYYGQVYQINYLCCIFCGFCIQARPIRTLTTANEYKLAGPTREGLVYEKGDLLAPMLEGMLAASHLMAKDASDADCYRGEVVDSITAQIEWVAKHRPDDPTLATAVPVDALGPFNATAAPAGAPIGSAAAPAGASGGEHAEDGR